MKPNLYQIRVEGISDNSSITSFGDFLNYHEVFRSPVNTTKVATAASGVQHVVLGSGVDTSFKIATSTSTSVDDSDPWVFAAPLGAAVGTASTNTASSFDGKILNLCEVLSETNANLFDLNGYRIYGLVQTDGSDGDSNSGSNVQISFVSQDSTGTINLTSLDDSASKNIVFTLPYMRKLANPATYTTSREELGIRGHQSPEIMPLKLLRNGTFTNSWLAISEWNMGRTDRTPFFFPPSLDGTVRKFFLKSFVCRNLTTGDATFVPEFKAHEQVQTDTGNIGTGDTTTFSILGTDGGTYLNEGNYKRWGWNAPDNSIQFSSNINYGFRFNRSAGTTQAQNVLMDVVFQEMV